MNLIYISTMRMKSYSVISLCVFFSCIMACFCLQVQETRFFLGNRICYDDALGLSNGCAQRAPSSVQNKRQCLSSCQDQDWCVGVSLDNADKTYCVLHSECTWDLECSSPDANVADSGESSGRFVFYSKNCAHGGHWMKDVHKCRCVHGWVGDRCQKLPNDHTQLMAAGYPYGHYWVYLDLRTAIAAAMTQTNVSSDTKNIVAVKMFINPSTGYSNLNFLQHYGIMDFNRSFSEYRTGFKQDDMNFWLGFDTWRRITQAGYSTTSFFVLQFQSGKGVYRWYRNLTLGGAASGDDDDMFDVSFKNSFENVINGYSQGPFGECLESANQGIPFSTWDRDVDNNTTQNCAALRGSGWWFQNQCQSDCNLLGKFPVLGADPSTDPHQQFYVKGIDSNYFLLDPIKSFTIYSN